MDNNTLVSEKAESQQVQQQESQFGNHPLGGAGMGDPSNSGSSMPPPPLGLGGGSGAPSTQSEDSGGGDLQDEQAALDALDRQLAAAREAYIAAQNAALSGWNKSLGVQGVIKAAAQNAAHAAQSVARAAQNAVLNAQLNQGLDPNFSPPESGIVDLDSEENSTIGNNPTVIEPLPADNAPMVIEPLPADNAPTVIEPLPADNAPMVIEPLPADNAPLVIEPLPAGEGSVGGPEEASAADTPYVPQEVAVDASSLGTLVNSLGTMEPMEMIQGMQTIGPNYDVARDADREVAKEEYPSVPQPLGLDAADPANALDSSANPTSAGVTLVFPDSEIETYAKAPPKFDPGATNVTIEDGEGEVNISAGERERIQLDSDYDGDGVDLDLELLKTDVKDSRSTILTDETVIGYQNSVIADYGEADVFPEAEGELETLTGVGEFTEFETYTPALTEEMPEISMQSAGDINAGIKGEYQDEIDLELAKEVAGKTTYQEGLDAEALNLDTNVGEEVLLKEAEQTTARTTAITAVEGHKLDWLGENDGNIETFDTDALAEKAKIDTEIKGLIDGGNTEVDGAYTQAETDAANENTRLQGEREKQKPKKGFWGWIKGAWNKFTGWVKGAWNSFKTFVTNLWDGLVSAVKAIVKRVRKAVKTAMDKLKTALGPIVTRIKAAFKTIADKFIGFINDAIDALKTAFSAIVTALKTAVQAVLDAVATVVRGLVKAYEAVVRAVLTAIEFIVDGIMKIIQIIKDLISAARGMPDQFPGQASEEVFGADVTEALGNEYPSLGPVELGAGEGEAGDELAFPQDALDLLGKESYTEDDFLVEPYGSEMELDSELLYSLAQQGDGEYDLGEYAGEENGIEALKNDFGVETVEEGAELEGGESMNEGQLPGMPLTADRDRFAADENGMVGPFTAGERIRYLATMMGEAMWNWFQEKWPMVLGILLGLIGGFILVNILTGGAAMAMVPLMIQALGAIFTAEAAVRAAAYLGKYIGDSVQGNVEGGSKNLARAIAIGAFELLFAFLTGPEAVIKGAKGGVKGAVQGVRNGVKQTIRSVGKIAQITKTGLKTAKGNIIRGGKFVMKGLSEGSVKVSKTAKGLGQTLADLTRFKGFKMEIGSGRWILYGIINPKVPIASGLLPKLKKVTLKGPDGSEKIVNLNDEDFLKYANNHAIKKTWVETPDGPRMVVEVEDVTLENIDEIVPIEAGRGRTPRGMDNFPGGEDVTNQYLVILGDLDMLKNGPQDEAAESLYKRIFNNSRVKNFEDALQEEITKRKGLNTPFSDTQIEDFRKANIQRNIGEGSDKGTGTGNMTFNDALAQFDESKVWNSKTGNWVADQEIGFEETLVDFNVSGVGHSGLDQKLNVDRTHLSGKNSLPEESGNAPISLDQQMDEIINGQPSASLGPNVDYATLTPDAKYGRTKAIEIRDHKVDPSLSDKDHRHSAHYKKWNKIVIDLSESAGENAGEGFIQLVDPNADRLLSTLPGAQKNGEFDQVYKTTINGEDRVVIVEAKGGTSTLGKRHTPEGNAKQGTPEYVDSVLANMKDAVQKPGIDPGVKSRLEATIKAVEDAKADGTLDYYVVRQGFTKDGAGNIKASDVEVKKFGSESKKRGNGSSEDEPPAKKQNTSSAPSGGGSAPAV